MRPEKLKKAISAVACQIPLSVQPAQPERTWTRGQQPQRTDVRRVPQVGNRKGHDQRERSCRPQDEKPSWQPPATINPNLSFSFRNR